MTTLPVRRVDAAAVRLARIALNTGPVCFHAAGYAAVMAAGDDLGARVAAVEARLAELTHQVQHNLRDAAAARVLAGGADRDVTEMGAEIRDFRRATTSALTAMREDFSDLRGDFTDLRQQMGTGFTEVRGRLDAAAAGQQQIVDLLTSLLDQPPPASPSDP